MSDYLTPTTELEAVNTILSVISESPVSTLEDIEAADAAIALNVLREVSRRVQAKGWHWNTETELTVTPEVSTGFIRLATNCLRVDTVKNLSPGLLFEGDVVERNGRLYDRKTQSYVFAEPFKVDMVLVLPFSDLPEAARDYITIRASRTFQQRQLGSVTLNNFSEDEEKEARETLEHAEAETADFNMLKNNNASRSIYRNRRAL